MDLPLTVVAVTIAGVSAVVSAVSAVSAVVAVPVAGIAVVAVAVIAAILFVSHQIGDGGLGCILGQHRQHQADQQNLKETIKIFVTSNGINSVRVMSMETNRILTASFIIFDA